MSAVIGESVVIVNRVVGGGGLVIVVGGVVNVVGGVVGKAGLAGSLSWGQKVTKVTAPLAQAGATARGGSRFLCRGGQVYAYKQDYCTTNRG